MTADTPKGTLEIAKDVFWVGIKHHNRRLFDGLIPLPFGTSYNAYLVKGSSKIALIDTVNPGFQDELIEKISERVDPAKIDYVIMNHAEPDHAYAGQYILKVAPNAKLVTSKKGKEASLLYFDVPESRIMTVDDGAKIDLGGRTLEFISAPWLHWPETMFTFLVEDGIMFPCDFFGQHTALGEFYADELGNGVTLDRAKVYFAEIMMPFRKQCLEGIEKVKKRNVKLIAPSHGVMYRDPKIILDAYSDWAGEKMQRKVLIAYVSMWGSTEKMVKVLAESLVKKGIEVNIYDITNSDIAHIAKELVDTPVVVVGAPTVLAGAHPVAAYVAMLVKALRAPTKYAAVLTSHGWSGGAVKMLQDILAGTKIEILGAVDATGRPKQKDIEDILALSDKIAEKVP
jgi:flavorubredoxin